MTYIHRHAEKTVKSMLKMFKVVMITGPRQSGKTTLLRHTLGDEYNYVTLDDINDLNDAKNDPKLFFMNHSLPLIIDEVQNAPELFPEIKRIVDTSDEYGKIVLTGSQAFPLMNNVTESLAGRIGILELSGLSLRELTDDKYDEPFIPDDDFLNVSRKNNPDKDLWSIIQRGSMPELYNNEDLTWPLFYASYVTTYVERDIRSIINVRNINQFSAFMVSIAARTGQLLNYNAVADDIDVDIKTVKSWTGILETSGIIKLLQPFSNNHLKRVVKRPMIYFMDTGLVCYLLKWNTKEALMKGAMSGNILETFAVSEIVKSFKNKGILQDNYYFYRDKDKKEIDIIIEDKGYLYPVEIKKSAAPKPSMAKNFSLLEKAEGYKMGTKTVLCLVDKKRWLTKEILAYPISEI